MNPTTSGDIVLTGTTNPHKFQVPKLSPTGSPNYPQLHMLKLHLPRNALEAASWEPSLAYETARATAVETTLSGLMWTFSPMVDTARDQRWGRNVEGAGEDPLPALHF